MNESEFLDKLDEIGMVASRLLAHSERLERQVESLREQVLKLDERLAYRERVLTGWKEIATYLGFRNGLEVCRQMARREFDPLPVVKQFGVILAHATALDAWKERQKDYRRSNFDPSDSESVPGERPKPRLVVRESDETPS